jgi:predicted aspartyl protease
VSFAFDAQDGLILVRTELVGPAGSVMLQLALDTGASGTLINAGPLLLVGYDPSSAAERIQVTTGSGVEHVPRIPIDQLRAIGRECRDFAVIVHTLPPSAGIDGLLGLDFLRGRKLTVDFRQGILALQ